MHRLQPCSISSAACFKHDREMLRAWKGKAEPSSSAAEKPSRCVLGLMLPESQKLGGVPLSWAPLNYTHTT